MSASTPSPASAPGSASGDRSSTGSDAAQANGAAGDATEGRDAPTDGDGGAESFVETSYGIVTENGRWYHATAEMLEAYAGEVLKVVPLKTLLQRADRWIEAPRTITLWALPALLATGSPLLAAGAALAVYLALKLLAPSAPIPLAVQVVGGMQNVVGQAAYYVLTLSALATSGGEVAVGVGLAGFVLLRWQLVDRAAAPLVRPLLQRIYPLPVTDQVLRGLIVRLALKHRLQLSHIDDLAGEIMENWGEKPDDPPRPGDDSKRD
jgi:hypothetical protein